MALQNFRPPPATLSMLAATLGRFTMRPVTAVDAERRDARIIACASLLRDHLVTSDVGGLSIRPRASARI